jgi:hypothetical protein
MKTKIISAINKTHIDLQVQTAIGHQTVKITVDDSDRERIQSQKWFAFVNGDTLIAYTDIGSPNGPHMMPLANFILSIGADIYVEHNNGRANDFRVANLRAQRSGKG